jgi:small-conductance mechanosensitive channel
MVGEFYTADFFADHGDVVQAVATVLVTVVIAQLVDRVLARRGRKLGTAVGVGELSPVAITRLRLVRRLVYAAIIVLGVGLALLSFPEIRQVATGILASSAVLGLVIGFAARQTLANGIAGILLAISQPIRIDDLVTFEEQTGVVEDMKLSYTYIRLEDGRRLIVPNERLAQSSVVNHTILDPRVRVEVSVWLPPDADLDKAMELIRDEAGDIDVSVAEVDKEGVRLSATTWAPSPSERGKTAAELRQRWLRLLREHALSSAEA